MNSHSKILVLFVLNLLPWPCFAASETVITGPAGSTQFGESVVLLPNGNFVVTDSEFDQASPALTNVGFVSLYRHDGTLISTLTGSSNNDFIGSAGVKVLENGNFVVLSPLWNNGGTTDVGAVTWGHADRGFGASEVRVSSANSLIGSLTGDSVGSSGVILLTNGNYVVVSPVWDNVGTNDAGAVTLCDGTTGRVGTVASSNSFVGAKTGDLTFAQVVALANGNYVIRAPFYDNGSTLNVGAVTWGDGVLGVTGTASTSKSLMGTRQDDIVGIVTALSNGNYVVTSLGWDLPSPVKIDVGAVTWCSGATGRTGTISEANSLIGGTVNDRLGSEGIVPLANGNFLVCSPDVNTPAANGGAVTWGSGTAGIAGTVSLTNSLMGPTASDFVGLIRPIALSNGHYVVLAPQLDNGSLGNVGAAVWCDGGVGRVGSLTPDIALTGSSDEDQIGARAVALTNGNYAVISTDWDSPTSGVQNVGAVTFGNGKTGTRGIVSAANSLIGVKENDGVGSELVQPLTNGNYVVVSDRWRETGGVAVGAVTFCNGTTGTKGPVTTANSLIGSNAADFDDAKVLALTNGNYVVVAPEWNRPSPLATDVGSATWGSGTAGVKGVVSAANSLIGNTALDEVGGGDNLILPNGNYVIASPKHDSVFLRVDSGAATWGDGTKGVKGEITSENSLVGLNDGDQVGAFTLGLSNGHYVAVSPTHNNGTTNGAVTLADGFTGTTGFVSRAHSVLGSVFNGGDFSVIHDPNREQLLISRTDEARVVLYGNNLRSLAKSGAAAPGSIDLAFAVPGLTAVNPIGAALWDTKLAGSGASGGKNTALYALASGSSAPDLVMQIADNLSVLGHGLPSNAKVTALNNMSFNQLGRGLFQATVSGNGISAANNRLLLMDTGASVTLVHRVGQPVPFFGGAVFSAMPSLSQSYNQDTILMSYKLKSGGPVNAGNDTGVLALNHAGGLKSSALREGFTSFFNSSGLTGTFGQFTPLAASPQGTRLHFLAGQIGTSGAKLVLQTLQTTTDTLTVGPVVTGNAPDMIGAENGVVKISGIPAVTGNTSSVIYKAKLSSASASNEAVYAGQTLLLRKSQRVDSFFNLNVTRIIAFWPIQSSQTAYLVEVSGPGVTGKGNQVLLLRQNMTSGNIEDFSRYLLLLIGSRTLAGVAPAKIGKILAVEVNPISGDYAVLTTLTGCPANRNQALWTGNTLLGSDGSAERFPRLALRKGDRYSSANTPLGVIKSISLKPAPNPTGAGGRGLATCVGNDGSTAVQITTDGNKTELVLVK